MDESGCFRSDELLKLEDRIQLAGSFKHRFKVTFSSKRHKKRPGVTLKGSGTRRWCRTLSMLIKDVCLLNNNGSFNSTKYYFVFIFEMHTYFTHYSKAKKYTYWDMQNTPVGFLSPECQSGVNTNREKVNTLAKRDGRSCPNLPGPVWKSKCPPLQNQIRTVICQVTIRPVELKKHLNGICLTE